MMQVLLFHAWFIGSPIGVDAFIMVSSYLMTASFVRRSAAGEMPFFFERWMTTFKRLLPPLAIVVLGTLTLSFAILPATRWRGMLTQSYASLTYWQNWLLASLSTDYYAENHALSSPLQHLWSMSMQGQMFLLWPVLMTACVLVARKFKLSVRKCVFVVFAALTAVSLLWLLLWAPDNGSVYFDTRARIWEFAFGSAIAAIAPRLRVGGLVAKVVTTIALGVLVVFCVVSIGSYPGPWAFIPLTAVSVLLVTPAEQATWTERILTWRPLTALGDMSYAVYLLHWPLFVFFLVATDQSRLGFPEGAVLILLSIGLASLLTRFVDDPVRHWVWANRNTARKALIVGLTLWLSLTAVFTLNVGVAQEAAAQERAASEAATRAALDEMHRVEAAQRKLIAQRAAQADAQAEAEAAEAAIVLEGFPGAAALIHPGPVRFTADPIPGPMSLEDQWELYERDCDGRAGELFYEYPQSGCSRYGSPTNGTVLVAGGSHAEQVLMPALRLFADNEGVEVTAVLQAACHWAAPGETQTPNCQGNNQNLLTYVNESPPDYAFLLVTQATADSNDEKLIPGVEELIKTMTATGTKVFGIRDNLRSESDLYECSVSRPEDSALGGCLLQQSDYFAKDNPARSLQAIDGFHFIDTMDLYCQDGVCPTIAGNVFVYLDTNHVTKSYGQTMAPIIVSRVEEALAP